MPASPVSAAPRPQDGDAIQVVARFRPNPAPSPFTIQSKNITVVSPDRFSANQKFAFDHVLSDATQAEVFGCTGTRIARDVLAGYTGTILAYGQTGSGKTHTMMGSAGQLGIIPRIVDAIFAGIQTADDAIGFTVKLSYVEIYLERIRDLLKPNSDNLLLSGHPLHGGFFVGGVTEVYVKDARSIIKILHEGGKNRAVGSTLMNHQSSRSHSILQMTVSQVHGTMTKSGKLYLVDLAGSERASRSGAVGLRLDEAKKINKSLSALGNVINAITEGMPHVPYRDSKLTQLLQDSIGGNSRTVLVICCSSDQANLGETMSTLRFGERAKRIRNHAEVNVELTVEELKARLARSEHEVVRLKQLQGGPQEAVPEPAHTEEEWQEMLDILSESNATLQDALDQQTAELMACKEELGSLRRAAASVMSGPGGSSQNPTPRSSIVDFLDGALTPSSPLHSEYSEDSDMPSSRERCLEEAEREYADRAKVLERQILDAYQSVATTQEKQAELLRYKLELAKVRQELLTVRASRDDSWVGSLYRRFRAKIIVIRGGNHTEHPESTDIPLTDRSLPAKQPPQLHVCDAFP